MRVSVMLVGSLPAGASAHHRTILDLHAARSNQRRHSVSGRPFHHLAPPLPPLCTYHTTPLIYLSFYLHHKLQFIKINSHFISKEVLKF